MMEKTKPKAESYYILTGLVIVSWMIVLWELYINFRQHLMVQKLAELPTVLDGLMDADVYKKARSYFLDNSTYGIFKIVYRQILNTILMTCGFYFAWIWGKYLVEYIGLNPANEIYVTAGCMTIMIICLAILYDLPFVIYYTFVLEKKHNSNNQTPLLFAKDQLMEFLVFRALPVPCICGLVWVWGVMNSIGIIHFRHYVSFAVGLNVTRILSFFLEITPVSNRYTPLPEGDLKNCIKALASSLNFPLNGIYIRKSFPGSSYSQPAYLCGSYKSKMIVLSDTLIGEYQKKKTEEEEKAEFQKHQSCSEDTDKEKKEDIARVTAIVARELAHWGHSRAFIKDIFFDQVILVCTFISCVELMQYAHIYEAFGFTDDHKIVLIVVLAYVLAPLFKLLIWARRVILQSFELRADKFAASVGCGEALQRDLMVKLREDNLDYPLFDKLYSIWYKNEPSLLERLDAIKKIV